MSRNDQILAVAFLGLPVVTVLAAGAVLSGVDIGTAIGGFSAAVTAVATIVLARFTFVLARETKRLADVGEQPNIVVTFEPNRHSMMFLDVHAENTGTATAYNIELAIDPPLQVAPPATPDGGFPLRKISVLKPRQMVSSSLASWGELQTKRFTVRASWQRSPQKTTRENLTYDVDLNYMEGMSRLGGDPQVELADATKKIADNVGKIASGWSRLEVNTYTEIDREREKQEREKFREQQRARAAKSAGQPPEAEKSTK